MLKKELLPQRIEALIEQHGPMTREQLVCALGVRQQRISEALRALKASKVGYQPPPAVRAGKGHSKPAPVYGLHAVAQPQTVRSGVEARGLADAMNIWATSVTRTERDQ